MPQSYSGDELLRLFEALIRHPGPCLARAALMAAALGGRRPATMLSVLLFDEQYKTLTPMLGLRLIGEVGTSAAFDGFAVPAGVAQHTADGVLHAIEQGRKAGRETERKCLSPTPPAGASDFLSRLRSPSMSEVETVIADLVLDRGQSADARLATRLQADPQEVRHWVLRALARRDDGVAAQQIFLASTGDYAICLDLLRHLPAKRTESLLAWATSFGAIDSGEQARLLVDLFKARALPALTSSLRHPLRRVRLNAMVGLIAVGRDAVPALLEVTESGLGVPQKLAILELAAGFGDRRLLAFANAHVHSPMSRLRCLALLAIGNIDRDGAEPTIIAALQDRSPEVGALAVEMLSRALSVPATMALVECIGHSRLGPAARAGLGRLAQGNGPVATLAARYAPGAAPQLVYGRLGDPEDLPMSRAAPNLDAEPSSSVRTLERLPLPATKEDCYFSVRAPARVDITQAAIVEVWCHSQPPDVFFKSLAAMAVGRSAFGAAGPLPVDLGTTFEVSIRLDGFDVEEPVGPMRWHGKTSVLGFLARPRSNLTAGSRMGSADITVEGLRIARIHFQIEIGATDGRFHDCTVDVERVRTAFASYASEDRDRVLARLQGMIAALPDLDIFLDVVGLRAGEDWQRRLEDEILARDRFFLFWSVAASRSRWVEFEWRTALKAKGIEHIAPVSLDNAAIAPPPPDLAARHFGDWTRAI